MDTVAPKGPEFEKHILIDDTSLTPAAYDSSFVYDAATQKWRKITDFRYGVRMPELEYHFGITYVQFPNRIHSSAETLVIHDTCYAPKFVNVNGCTWFRLPSYIVEEFEGI